MLTIGFVVTPGFPVMSLAALSVFEFANTSTEKRLYDVRILSDDGVPVSSASNTSLETSGFGDARFDTVIIGGNTRVVPTSPKLLAFLAEAAKSSRRVSSICTGIFALADAGLIGERRVTTHWLFTEPLKSRYPDIRLEADRIFVVDGPIWTAAGNSAGIDLTLHMLEQDYGTDLALSVARILVVDYRRSGGQSQHSALLEMNPKSDRIQEVPGLRAPEPPHVEVGRGAGTGCGPQPSPVQSGLPCRDAHVPRKGHRKPPARRRAPDDRAEPAPRRDRCARDRLRRSGTHAPCVHPSLRPISTSASG